MSASLASIFSALATIAIACCLPLGFAAALGAGAASAFFGTTAPLAFGPFSCASRRGVLAAASRQAIRRARGFVGRVLLWAVTVVPGMILFPQRIAGFIADRFYGAGNEGKANYRFDSGSSSRASRWYESLGPSRVPPGQEPLVIEFEKAFDAVADVPRLVLLLSSNMTNLSAGGLRG